MLKGVKNDISMEIETIAADMLTRIAAPVDDVSSDEIQSLIQTMYKTMEQEKGVGLAAPQINVSKQVAVISTEGQKFTVINPKIIARSDEMIIFKEGCLSVPGKELDIFRHQKITVQYTDENGKKNKLKASDFLSIVFQHEIDHLNGILMTDRYAKQKNLRDTYNIPQNTYE